MPKIIVEPEKGNTFAAMKDGRVVARGDTQLEAGEKAHDKYPKATIEAARVRTTQGGKPDQFRHLFGPKRKGA